MAKRVWNVIDKKTGRRAQLAEITNPRGCEWAAVWGDEASRFTDGEAMVLIAYLSMFAKRFGVNSNGRFQAVEVPHA